MKRWAAFARDTLILALVWGGYAVSCLGVLIIAGAFDRA